MRSEHWGAKSARETADAVVAARMRRRSSVGSERSDSMVRDVTMVVGGCCYCRFGLEFGNGG